MYIKPFLLQHFAPFRCDPVIGNKANAVPVLTIFEKGKLFSNLPEKLNGNRNLSVFGATVLQNVFNNLLICCAK